MRLFHLSDLHIGLKLLNRDMREEQEYILNRITELAAEKKPDAVLIAGDIYDKPAPSGEAIEVFGCFVERLRKAVPEAYIMMISGNHDSAVRLDCFRGILAEQRLYMIGKPPIREGEFMEKVTLEDAYGRVHFYLLPFVRPSMVREITGIREDGSSLSYHEAVRELIRREAVDRTERNVFVSHQFYVPFGKNVGEVERMDSEIRTVGNIDEVGAELLDMFDYAALGHIHKPMKAGSENIRYCGTPLAASFSEAGQEKAVLMVDLEEKGKVLVNALPLVPRRKVRVIKGKLADVLKQGCEDYVSVELTDKAGQDVIDMQDKLRLAFPNLLEIRREAVRKADYERAAGEEALLNPFELCCLFLYGMDEEDKKIISDIINKVKGAD